MTTQQTPAELTARDMQTAAGGAAFLKLGDVKGESRPTMPPPVELAAAEMRTAGGGASDYLLGLAGIEGESTMTEAKPEWKYVSVRR